jgi:hypothetical protein
MSGNRDLPNESDVSMSPDCGSNSADRSPRSFRLQLSVSPSPPATPSPPAERVRPPVGRTGWARLASPTFRPSHRGLRRHLSDAARLLARLRSFIGEDIGSSPDSAGLLSAGDFAIQCSPRLSLPPRVALTEPHPRDTWTNLAEMERFLDNRKCRASPLPSPFNALLPLLSILTPSLFPLRSRCLSQPATSLLASRRRRSSFGSPS